MDAKLVVLKLFLDSLNIPSEIDSLDDRKRVQKAVYLGQLSGVDLGYRFGWYLKGPYSPSLTEDYYALAEAIESDDSEYEGKTFRTQVTEKLNTIKPLMDVPSTVNLEKEDWLELVSSVHYLRRVQKREESKANEILKKEKKHLFPFKDEAVKMLKEVGLLA